MNISGSSDSAPLLELSGLKVEFETSTGWLRVIHGVDLDVRRSEILGLVGESGSGKSVTCMAVMRLLGSTARIEGTARFEELDLLSLDEREMTQMRGSSMAMIFQDPMSSLNPIHNIGRQIIESIYYNPVKPRPGRENGTDHRKRGIGVRSRNSFFRKKAAELLAGVGISAAKQRLPAYPHQLSGGMNQRAMIAMSLAGQPKLLIADEPTTALDVTIQAQILELIRLLRVESGLSVILITHDLGVVAETCDRAAVMYCGRIVEMGPVDRIFNAPRHPYTRGLLASIPRIDRRSDKLVPLKGSTPSPFEVPDGCAFEPRCSHADDGCRSTRPVTVIEPDGHRFACFNPQRRSLTCE